jgi:methionine synthase II (cobalamin-independent)
MHRAFHGECRPVLIGSMPLTDHHAANRLVLDHTPAVPVWAQLPRLTGEGMVDQFLPGMPGVNQDGDRVCIDTAADGFDTAVLSFYERYLAMENDGVDPDAAGFALDPATAVGFYVLERALDDWPAPLSAVKGQVTGPITFTTAVKDQHGQSIFYDDQLRDAAVKLLAANARFQVDRLGRHGVPVIVFIDEPALAGFGTSEYISMTREDVTGALAEVCAAIHAGGGLAGIHVCANTDWSMVIDAPVDILNFDAFAYFDRFMLYGDAVRAFLESGRVLAWGIVPTLEKADIDGETVDSLKRRFYSGIDQLASLGFSRDRIMRQSLITPSCGVGSLDPDTALRVLALTRDLSSVLRSELGAGSPS